MLLPRALLISLVNSMGRSLFADDSVQAHADDLLRKKVVTEVGKRQEPLFPAYLISTLLRVGNISRLRFPALNSY